MVAPPPPRARIEYEREGPERRERCARGARAAWRFCVPGEGGQTMEHNLDRLILVRNPQEVER